jgi:uncharacterized membrane protein YeaQ/YmgE (transglycosylase-associated protein family)
MRTDHIGPKANWKHSSFSQMIGVVSIGRNPDSSSASDMSEGPSMSIFGWIILGLVAGFIASKIVNAQGQGLMLDIGLGVLGAIVGGFLFSLFGAQGVTGFNLYSMIVAIAGSIVVLWVYHALMGRRAI